MLEMTTAVYFANSTIGSVPGYSGKFSWYFAASSGGTNRPPRKCRLPLNSRAHIFGAVSDTSTSGCIPDVFPCSTSQPTRSATYTAFLTITITLAPGSQPNNDMAGLQMSLNGRLFCFTVVHCTQLVA